MRQNLRFVLLALAAVGLPGAASVQSALAQRPQSMPPAQSEPCDPSTKPLSGCSSGVIRPPVTGDKGVVTPPDQGKAMPMPVIPPPGSPGGDPNVQPK
jgi:hypothetical protein